MVWTDHKNLSYLQTAKRLNSRQARWSLFFGRLNVILPYRPGSRNIRPDALSRQFLSGNSPAPLTPSSLRPASRLRLSPGRLSPLSGGPKLQNWIRVMAPRTAFFSQVLLWCHPPHFACHPGVNHTLSLLKRHFWWQTMDADTRSVCARAKSSHQPPADLLRPLPIPGRPWSQIGHTKLSIHETQGARGNRNND